MSQTAASNEDSALPVEPPKGALLSIFLIVLVDFLGFGLIIPLLPFYIPDYENNPLKVTLLFSVYSICQFIGAPILGALSDRYGRRPILILRVAKLVTLQRDPREHILWSVERLRINLHNINSSSSPSLPASPIHDGPVLQYILLVDMENVSMRNFVRLAPNPPLMSEIFIFSFADFEHH